MQDNVCDRPIIEKSNSCPYSVVWLEFAGRRRTKLRGLVELGWAFLQGGSMQGRARGRGGRKRRLEFPSFRAVGSSTAINSSQAIRSPRTSPIHQHDNQSARGLVPQSMLGLGC